MTWSLSLSVEALLDPGIGGLTEEEIWRMKANAARVTVVNFEGEYTDDKAALFEALPQEYANTLVELIYVTDRAPETDEGGNLRYGYNRSNSLAIGTTVVNLGHNATWEELVEASRTHTRIGDFELRLVSIDEFARLPPTPMPYAVIEGKVVEDPEVVKVMEPKK